MVAERVYGMTRRDPVEAEADGSRDLYDVSTWEPRTALDRLAVSVYRAVVTTLRGVVIVLGLLILVSQFLLGGIGATFAEDPYAIWLVTLSVIPALLLAGYIYVSDITTSEPLELLVGTFVLGVVFAGFAAIVNSLLGPLLRVIPVVGIVLFFYLVVAPVEEAVKLLAVRLHPYRSDSFDAVVDGAVYGAVAGLGFATIENALYITRGLSQSGEQFVVAVGDAQLTLVAGGGMLATVGLKGAIGNIIGAGGQITALRALAGPGHVIYSAFAGYYLGLAKFNSRNAGPIVAKGLLIATFIHGTYNVLVGVVPGLVALVFPDVSQLLVFFAFVLVYDGLFFGLLFRKLSRYRAAYEAVGADAERRESEFVPDRTEFER